MLSPVKALHPQQLCKRDGSIAAFDLGKIRQAIIAAGAASGEFDEALAGGLGEAGLLCLLGFARIAVETVQDTAQRAWQPPAGHPPRQYFVELAAGLAGRDDRLANPGEIGRRHAAIALA